MKVYLTIAGVVGEVTADPFKDSIECQSFSFERRVRGDDGQPLAKESARTLEVVKLWDKASPFLGQALVKSTTYPKATITCGEFDAAAKFVKHLVLDLTNAQVIELHQSVHDGGSNVPVEEIRLLCTGLQIAYSPPGAAAKAVTG
jgi:type VI secretion system Hcp family effector